MFFSGTKSIDLSVHLDPFPPIKLPTITFSISFFCLLLANKWQSKIAVENCDSLRYFHAIIHLGPLLNFSGLSLSSFPLFFHLIKDKMMRENASRVLINWPISSYKRNGRWCRSSFSQGLPINDVTHILISSPSFTLLAAIQIIRDTF